VFPLAILEKTGLCAQAVLNANNNNSATKRMSLMAESPVQPTRHLDDFAID